MCKIDIGGKNMPTNLGINDELLTAAHEASGLKTKKDTVNLALEQYLKDKLRREAIAMFGTIDFDEDWSPRKARGKPETPESEKEWNSGK
jgi:Arc/MetJ family transcription regulator